MKSKFIVSLSAVVLLISVLFTGCDFSIPLPGGAEDVSQININNAVTIDTSNNGNISNNTANDITNNPTKGDVGIVGYIGLGLTSVLGLFKNRRKRK